MLESSQGITIYLHYCFLYNLTMQPNELKASKGQIGTGAIELEENEFLNTEKLEHYIGRIEDVFDSESVLGAKIDKNKVQAYYHDSNIGYNLVHSKDGAVHMALNYNGMFSEDGYYQQVREIEKHLSPDKKNMVLELGCGKGFNSFYLADKVKGSSFQGIDISNKHLSYAKKKAKGLENLNFSFGDFHSINFEDSIFDVVFELESVCHSNDPEKLLREVHRVLKKGGKFVLYEGFRSPGYENLTDLQKKMAVLIEKSMAVNEGYRVDLWLETAKKVGFKVETNDDISYAIMPNLIRFHRLARKYFKYTFLSKLILAIMPSNLIKNTIAGLLMPFSIMQEVQTYNRIILRKK